VSTYRWMLLLAVSVVCFGVFGGVASAGRYHVYSCRTPAGEVAPTEGWVGSVGGDTNLDTCQSGGGLVAALRGGIAHPADEELTTWSFDPPANEKIAMATLWRAGEVGGGANENASYLFWLAGVSSAGTDLQTFVECAAVKGCTSQGILSTPLAESNRVAVPDSALQRPDLAMTASCGSSISGYACPLSGDAASYAAIVELFAADLVLEQSTAPSVSGVAGDLTSAATLTGMSDVEFDASDSGSGVYEAIFTVDGQPVQRRVLNDNGGHCRNVGQATDGLPAFLYPQPCPLTLSADVPFDSTVVPNGQHQLVVSVTNAAGNATTALERDIVISNPGGGTAASGTGNGSDPSEHATLTATWQGARGARLTVGYGRRPVIQGRLTDANGRGIAGAVIDAATDPGYLGSRNVALPSPHTDSSGRFSLHLPRDISSGTVLLGYRAHLGDARPVATRTLALGVRAGLMLDITPHTTSVGRSIHFRGHLLGTPIPPGGKQLVLEANSGGSTWIEFHVLHTDNRGRFHASYRFRYPGPVTYRFRAVSRAEADYPYLVGASDEVAVRER
jgi:hypothetical protein